MLYNLKRLKRQQCAVQCQHSNTQSIRASGYDKEGVRVYKHEIVHLTPELRYLLGRFGISIFWGGGSGTEFAWTACTTW
jgi:hypothetical protein